MPHMYLQNSGEDLRSVFSEGGDCHQGMAFLKRIRKKGVIHLRGTSVRAVSIKCSLFCGKKHAALTFVNTYLSTTVFETRTVTGSEQFSLLTCPHTTTITSLSIFSPLGTSSIKILEAILS